MDGRWPLERLIKQVDGNRVISYHPADQRHRGATEQALKDAGRAGAS
ncbi:hypothetical protein [Streptomyces sp. CB03911]|nr:hypothetical protein [Streptomyces sp. CB03911]